MRGSDQTGSAAGASHADEADALQETAAELQLLWDQGPFVARLDLQGTVTDANRAWVEGCGFERASIVGRPLWECGWWRVATNVQQWVRNAVARAVAGESFQGESRYWLADGSDRMLDLRCSPIRNAAGIVTRLLATGTDLGGIRQSTSPAESVSEAEARIAALLSAIVDSSDDAIISKDLNGTIMTWNLSAERVFGYTAEEAIGRSIMLIIPPERADEEPRIIERLKRGERVDHFETIRVRKDGRRINISLTISPVKDGNGRIVGASKVARDITEHVRHARALEEANAALQRANADLEQFAYSASHDLQEPLRMVASYSELLQRKFGGQLGPQADEYIRYTVQGALRMETLLRDLRTYTQLSTMDAAAPEEIDANDVLKKTLANLDVPIRDNGAKITSAVLPRVRMHEFQLEQVFQNLISNSIRYRSAAPPEIRVAAVQEGAHWLFSIQDNGIGIDPRYKEQVFGIFKRLHNTAQYPGTGMGLAICQRVIERVGGRIWVESEPGRGATFFFTIPLEKYGTPSGPPGQFDSADRGQSRGRGLGA
ncbi:MAG TPA: PAS domain S-box protein [Bryobacteraceae bacterium]|nr:PAS domain S-box protein [Bryobacteraceae bacterium]